jgi:2-(1,2-epoxy-1,2-dihydrophenyl)acetyl-CoA isomerase
MKLETSPDNEFLVSVDNGIKTMTINKPEKRNALSPGNARVMAREVEQSADDGTRVLLITGAGGSFCAGADLQSGVFSRALKEGAPPEAEIDEMVDTTFHRLARAVYDLPRPVIAAVDGSAAGFGCSLALGADITLASDRARFILVFINIALIPDGGSCHILPRLIGMKKAMEMAMTGDPVSAWEALEMQMINRVYPREELAEQARNWARRLSGGAVTSMGAAKRTMHEAGRMNFKEALDLECRTQARFMTRPDFLNAVAAFLEKKKPKFS